MADEKSRDSIDDRKIYSVDREDKIDGDELIDSSSTVISPASDIEASTTGSVVNSIASGDGTDSCLSDRLSEILMDNSDGDVLLQQSDRETNFLPWLQALDMQMMGACRADERLKPLLKVNNPSSGAAEDRLLAHLSQHFEATEVGLLARCLCIPLVSIRVGKVSKQGTLLCPSSSRGNLNLTLLPSSNFRISFVGDNGKTDRLATLTSRSECSAIAIERIPSDESGRCFLIKISRDEVFYFWCSEKSKLLGLELLSKMEDLLKKKLTLAEMTGICDSRLERFVTHLRDYLIGSKLNHSRASNAALLNPVLDLSSDATKLGFSAQLSSASANHLHPHHDGGQAFNTHPVSRGSLSPRSCSFKEGSLPRNFSPPRIASREKQRYHAASVMADATLSCSDQSKKPDAVGSCSASPLSFLESLGKSPMPPFSKASSQPCPSGSLLSPYYCWCPPCPLPSMVPTSRLPVSSPELLSLPPLSSLLPGARSAAMLAESQLLKPSNTPIDFPAFLPDPRMRLPFSKQGSLTPVPTFTPLMCDPIVHIPVIDVCSSGQGYFVSAGSGIATSIPPFPESDIMVDKGARETLRLLISSSSTSTSPLMNVLPAVLNNDRDKGSFLLAGSRGLYSGTSNVEAIAKGIAAVGVVPLSERSSRGGVNTEDYGIRSGRGGSLDACEGVSDEEEAEDQ